MIQPSLSTREGQRHRLNRVNTDTAGVNLFAMLLPPTNYQKTKFEQARTEFPPGIKWTSQGLAARLEINQTTAERWILRWVTSGWVRKMITGEDLRVPNAAKFRYAFRAAPLVVRKFGES